MEQIEKVCTVQKKSLLVTWFRITAVSPSAQNEPHRECTQTPRIEVAESTEHQHSFGTPNALPALLEYAMCFLR